MQVISQTQVHNIVVVDVSRRSHINDYDGKEFFVTEIIAVGKDGIAVSFQLFSDTRLEVSK